MDTKGFTFLEVLFVFSVIGILSILAIPDISAVTDKFYLQSAARRISTDLREMKMRSVIEHSNFTLNLDTVNNYYDLPGRRFTLPQGVRFGFSQGVLGPPNHPADIPDTDGVTFPSNKISFYPQGTNSIGTIYLTSDRDMTMAISLSITGRVRIWRWNEGRWS